MGLHVRIETFALLASVACILPRLETPETMLYHVSTVATFYAVDGLEQINASKPPSDKEINPRAEIACRENRSALSGRKISICCVHCCVLYICVHDHSRRIVIWTILSWL
ncbi:hypothetical protein F5884DRAFT_776685 [Xylogone sp. PMI_703]|nr:hypothetical protein F5884DRAFT_776685 [Xylogone sp. PMI_703]